MVTITFRTDNAAFGDQDNPEDDNLTDLRAESARILRKIARTLEEGSDGGTILDLNGNKVGVWDLDGD